jgi:hypothetical protein
VFVYGTLMSEEVVRVLLGRVPQSSPALLPNQYVRAPSAPPGLPPPPRPTSLFYFADADSSPASPFLAARGSASGAASTRRFCPSTATRFQEGYAERIPDMLCLQYECRANANLFLCVCCRCSRESLMASSMCWIYSKMRSM